MPTHRVIVTDYQYRSLAAEEKVLTSIGATLEAYQCSSAEEVLAVSQGADGILVQHFQFTRDVIFKLDRCRVISCYRIGTDNIDLEAATEKGIVVVNVPGYCVDEVSDHALMLLLACARKLLPMNTSTQRGIWDFNLARPVYRLRGRTLGIIGFGKIGQRLAQKVGPLGLHVVAYDPFLPREVFAQLGVEQIELEELLRRSDFVSIHAPLSASSRALLAEKELQLMKPGSILINTARGGVVDNAALAAALRNGHLAAAGLDVVDVEPIPPDHPLLGLENVILTPHAAWYSEEAQVELQTRAALGVAAVLCGEMPEAVANPKVLEGLNPPLMPPTGRFTFAGWQQRLQEGN
jgi:D-3-phosphoglycerate dehydrogenase